MKKWISVVSAIIVLFILFHTTPSMALRTQVLLMGYPKAAITSGIIEDDYHNEVDKEKFTQLNAKAYTLTNPPIEKATQGELRSFHVRKIGFFHFAEYYGEG
ncbi:hypothetical protein [Guptibacillus algicola]|uniref:hypothetical protein n=1 Tax=Guptibacillus algicola TaxID=225844 RepID=UPI001CD712AF|nr:hypothetical protein [Alkalihalobacillus algicola]MCA0985692.1 hypothetical protein [Alkalihalobacillus algicola]